MDARYHDDFVVGRELHHLTRRQQRSRRLRTGNHQMPEPGRQPVAGVMALRTSVPVVLDVPVRIPLAETELGPQFQRLGAIVDRLVTPVEPLLLMPETPPDSSK